MQSQMRQVQEMVTSSSMGNLQRLQEVNIGTVTTILFEIYIKYTVFTRISAIKIFMPQVWCLFEGGVYLKVDKIKSCINYSVDIFPIKLTELTSLLLILIILGWRCIFRGGIC